MDEISSWRPMPTPPPLPPPVWQRQGSSLQFKVRNTLDHVVSDPQAGAQTHTQKLVAGLDPAKIQEVAASQVEISEMYYQNVLQHARRLFRWALIAAGTGLIFFLAAVALLVWHQPVNGALISLTSGGVMEALAALNFCLYGRVFNQFREFHERLDRTQQYLLANSICENLKGDVKQATQIELMRAMMHSLARQEEKTEKSTVR
jgi:Cyanobacterial TRADD-N associated 2-Transmembrane domain